jgi:hypothetical protein
MQALDVSPSARPFALSRPRPWSSKRWCDYFQTQRQAQLAIPWERGAGLSAADHDLIGPSLRVFQQGEAQEGGHFYRCARAYAETSHDLAYAVAHRLFMDEEKRHGGDLARFLARADIPVLGEPSWLTRAFCWCGSRGGCELTLLVILIERDRGLHLLCGAAAGNRFGCLARALRPDPARRKAACPFPERAPGDSPPHRPAELLVLTDAVDVLLFVVAALVCWCGHHRVLHAGGFEFGHFWCEAWRVFRAAARQKDSRNYAWR